MSTPSSPAPALGVDERLRLVQDTVGVGVFTVVPHSGLLEWDAWMAALFELDGRPADLATWAAALQHEDGQALMNAIHRCVATGDPFDLRIERLLASGDLRYLTCAGRLHPETRHVIGACWDVTARETARERFALAERLGRVGSWSFDLRNGAIEWSDQLYQLFARDPQEGPPDFAGAMHAHDDESEARLREAVQRAATEGVGYGLHLRTRYEPNGVQHLFARGQAKRDASGNIIGLFGTSQDVTAEVEGEQSIARIAACIPGAVYQYVAHPDGSYAFPYISGGVQLLYGLTPKEVEENPAQMFGAILDEDLPALQRSIEQSAQTLTRWHHQYRIRDRNGVMRHLQGTSNPVRRPDGSIVWHGYVGDVSDRVAFEAQLQAARAQAEQASRAKSDFLANMSHEIRTPMTAILGYLQLIEDQVQYRTPDINLGTALATVRTNARHLLDLINDILDVSKIEAGKLTVESLPTRIASVVEEVVQLCAKDAHEKGVALSTQWGDALPTWVATDPTRLRQVLVNIVGNAVKFTEQGSITISVQYAPRDHQLRIGVADTGIGMTPAQLEYVRAFNPFSQADSSMTRRFGGTGLGLCISSSLCRLLGGTLEIESELGTGSTFTAAVTARPAQAPSAPATRPRPARPSQLQGCRVLLAEDGPDNQRLIAFLLRRAGAQVELASDGIEAVRLATVDPPFDLVLMDMAMPQRNGYQATRQIRQAGLTMPIIALTAHAMADDRERCLRAGCNGYLSKPFQHQDLIDLCTQFYGVPAPP